LLLKLNSIAVRRSANHGFCPVAGIGLSAVASRPAVALREGWSAKADDPGGLFDVAIILDARSVALSFSTVPSGNPPEFAVTPRSASILALTMSILLLNCAEPVNRRGVPEVSCWRSSAVPDISSVAGVRPKALMAEGNSIVPRR